MTTVLVCVGDKRENHQNCFVLYYRTVHHWYAHTYQQFLQMV